MFETSDYEKDISSFNKITSSKAEEILNAENFVVIYIGRETCPYCRRFAKKLSLIKENFKQSIYYIDSDDFYDKDINTFRDKYVITTVPGFIVKTNNKIKVRCDSSMPEDEILSYINK